MAENFSDVIIRDKLELRYMVKGDLLTGITSDSIILPIGTNGQILRVNTSTTIGLQWSNPIIDYVFAGDNSSATISTTSNVFQTTLTLNTPSLVSTNTYRVNWFYEWGYSTNTQAGSNGFRGRVIFGTNATLQDQYMLPHYAVIDWIPNSGFSFVTGASGINTISFQYCTGVAGGTQTARIRRRRLDFWRVS